MRSVAHGRASFSPCFMMPFDEKGLNGSNPKHQINNSRAFDLVRFRKRQDLDAVFEEFFPKKPSLTVVRGGKV